MRHRRVTITSHGVGVAMATMRAMTWRGVRNRPFYPAVAILPSVYP